MDPEDMTDEEYARWLEEQEANGATGGTGGDDASVGDGNGTPYGTYWYTDPVSGTRYLVEPAHTTPDGNYVQGRILKEVKPAAPPKPTAAPGYKATTLADLQYAYENGEISGEQYETRRNEILLGKQSTAAAPTYRSADLADLELARDRGEISQEEYEDRRSRVLPGKAPAPANRGMTDYQTASLARSRAEFERKQALEEEKFQRQLDDDAQKYALDAEKQAWEREKFEATQARQKEQFEASDKVARDAAERDNFEDERDYNESNRRFEVGQGNVDRSFGENQRQFNENLGENKRQFDTTFGENVREFDIVQDLRERDFGEGIRRFDLGFGENKRQFDVSQDLSNRKFLADVSQNPRNWLQYANMLSGNYLPGQGGGDIAQGIKRVVPIAPGLVPAGETGAAVPGGGPLLSAPAGVGAGTPGAGSPGAMTPEAFLAANPDIAEFYKENGWGGRAAAEIVRNWVGMTKEPQNETRVVQARASLSAPATGTAAGAVGRLASPLASGVPATGGGYTASDMINVKRQLSLASGGSWGGTDEQAIAEFLKLAGGDRTQQALVARLRGGAGAAKAPGAGMFQAQIAGAPGSGMSIQPVANPADATANLAATIESLGLAPTMGGGKSVVNRLIAGKTLTPELQAMMNDPSRLRESLTMLGWAPDQANRFITGSTTGGRNLPTGTPGGIQLPQRLQDVTAGKAITPAGLPAGTIKTPGLQAQANMSPVEGEMYKGVAELQGIPGQDWDAQIAKIRQGMGAPGRILPYGGTRVSAW